MCEHFWAWVMKWQVDLGYEEKNMGRFSGISPNHQNCPIPLMCVLDQGSEIC